MDGERTKFWLCILLIGYLLVVGVGAALVLIINVPTETNGKITFPYVDKKTVDANDVDPNSFGENDVLLVPFLRLRSTTQALLALAFLAGIAGSFIHAAQSLGSFVGNSAFKPSWAVWYFLRPWIGGTLAFAIYVTFSAGLVGGPSTMNPYGIVALGLLGGWFSKITTDKLQEVFETFFKTDQDKQRKDKLRGNETPIIKEVKPSPVPPGRNEIEILGSNFQPEAIVLVDGNELKADYISSEKLKVSIANLPQRPAAGATAKIQVKNPEGPEPPLSEEHDGEFQ